MVMHGKVGCWQGNDKFRNVMYRRSRVRLSDGNAVH